MAKRKTSSVTIRAVAERAGVSPMTVSNVINRVGRVSPATAEVVRATITELGYVPNLIARRLATARPTTVGLMYNDQRTPFLEAILVGALRATNARGLQLVLHEGSAARPEEAEAAAGALVRSGVDALLLIPPYAELLSGGDFIQTSGVAAAAIATGGPLPAMSTVRIDNRIAMAELTALVAGKGHRRIGFVAGPGRHGDSTERFQGYRDALRTLGIGYDPALTFEGRFDYASGVDAARTLMALDAPPTAIVCSNDDMAAGVVAFALRIGMRLPRDLAVTGFDDTMIAARMWPPLTVVRQPIEMMAFTAVEQLIAGFEDEPSGKMADRIVDHQILERESVPDIEK